MLFLPFLLFLTSMSILMGGMWSNTFSDLSVKLSFHMVTKDFFGAFLAKYKFRILLHCPQIRRNELQLVGNLQY